MTSEILELLEVTPESFVKATFEHCLNLKVNQSSDRYTEFMARNYRHFKPLLSQIPLDRDYQRKHQLINYFMMLVYLDVMVNGEKAINDTGYIKNQADPGRLAYWITKFSKKLVNSEKSGTFSDNNNDGPDFGSRIKKVIETA